jgi:hypothetical protein
MKSSSAFLLLSIASTEAVSPVADFWHSIVSFANSGSAMDDLTDLSQPAGLLNCPDMAPETFCDTTWDPVLCDDKCQYGNACEAAASGYDTTTQCVSVATPVTVEETSGCPAMDPDLFCEQTWDPVICDNDCQYGNVCEASAAGFNVTTACVPVATAVPASSCPTADPELFCDQQWLPVLCTPGDCRYNNPCQAGAAGIDASTDCIPDDPTL